jgi:hypothetical protein
MNYKPAIKGSSNDSEKCFQDAIEMTFTTYFQASSFSITILNLFKLLYTYLYTHTLSFQNPKKTGCEPIIRFPEGKPGFPKILGFAAAADASFS